MVSNCVCLVEANTFRLLTKKRQMSGHLSTLPLVNPDILFYRSVSNAWEEKRILNWRVSFTSAWRVAAYDIVMAVHTPVPAVTECPLSAAVAVTLPVAAQGGAPQLSRRPVPILRWRFSCFPPSIVVANMSSAPTAHPIALNRLCPAVPLLNQILEWLNQHNLILLSCPSNPLYWTRDSEQLFMEYSISKMCCLLLPAKDASQVPPTLQLESE